MSRILFLDDCPTRRQWASVNLDKGPPDLMETAATAVECIRLIEWGTTHEDRDGPFWDVVYLDHDLSDEVYVDSSRPDCGMEVVRWIVENKPTIGKIVVHTMNTPAGHLMTRTLRLAGYDAKYRSFYRMINGLPALEGRQIYGLEEPEGDAESPDHAADPNRLQGGRDRRGWEG